MLKVLKVKLVQDQQVHRELKVIKVLKDKLDQLVLRVLKETQAQLHQSHIQ